MSRGPISTVPTPRLHGRDAGGAEVGGPGGIRGRGGRRCLGAPAAFDLNFDHLRDDEAELTINLGDPFVEGQESRNTKHLERAVVHRMVEILGGKPGSRWGYMPTGSTEALDWGVQAGREMYPDAVLYHSTAAHTCIPKAAWKARVEAVAVPAGPGGDIRVDALIAAVDRSRGAIIMLTLGTTQHEGLDDVAAVREAFATAGITRVYVHLDAAFAGGPLALARHPLGVAQLEGVDSWSTSGHKAWATREPCGVLLARHEVVDRLRHRRVPYTGDIDVTVSGCRPGGPARRLRHALTAISDDQHRARFAAARDLAAYTQGALVDLGYRAWRHPWAMTVVIDSPLPRDLVWRWGIFGHDGQHHVVTPPGVTRGDVDDFLTEVADLPRQASA